MGPPHSFPVIDWFVTGVQLLPHRESSPITAAYTILIPHATFYKLPVGNEISQRVHFHHAIPWGLSLSKGPTNEAIAVYAPEHLVSSLFSAYRL